MLSVLQWEANRGRSLSVTKADIVKVELSPERPQLLHERGVTHEVVEVFLINPSFVGAPQV